MSISVIELTAKVVYSYIHKISYAIRLQIRPFTLIVQVTVWPNIGALDGGGGPQCGLSNLRNGHVNCHYFFNFHVDFKQL